MAAPEDAGKVVRWQGLLLVPLAWSASGLLNPALGGNVGGTAAWG